MLINFFAKSDDVDGESEHLTPLDALPVINELARRHPTAEVDAFHFTGGEDAKTASMIIDISDVLVSSCQTGESSGADMLTEAITMDFTDIEGPGPLRRRPWILT